MSDPNEAIRGDGGAKLDTLSARALHWHQADAERAERAEEQAKKAKRWLIDAAGADVTDLLQSLDDCTARAERAEADLAAAKEQFDKTWAQREADFQALEELLAAARQQLDQVLAETLSWAADECHREARWRTEKRRANRPGDPEYDMRTEGVETASKLRDIFRQESGRAAAILDVPARPAGHDESGQ